MSVTLDVSQKLMLELNSDLPLKRSVISVTKDVHKKTFPLSTSLWIVELSTTVYVVPEIVAVSPTVALGHLHVSFSK